MGAVWHRVSILDSLFLVLVPPLSFLIPILSVSRFRCLKMGFWILHFRCKENKYRPSYSFGFFIKSYLTRCVFFLNVSFFLVPSQNIPALTSDNCVCHFFLRRVRHDSEGHFDETSPTRRRWIRTRIGRDRWASGRGGNRVVVLLLFVILWYSFSYLLSHLFDMLH